jgi:hypothetical protein
MGLKDMERRIKWRAELAATRTRAVVSAWRRGAVGLGPYLAFTVLREYTLVSL